MASGKLSGPWVLLGHDSSCDLERAHGPVVSNGFTKCGFQQFVCGRPDIFLCCAHQNNWETIIPWSNCCF